MPIKRRRPKARDHSLSLDERWSLLLGEADYRRAFADDAERRATWERHRDHLLMGSRHGRRPMAWWDYDSSERRNRRVEQCAQLYAMAELTTHELAELMERWRGHYETAQEPNYTYCTDRGWHTGDAARRAQYRWAGIPPEIVRRWDAERRRRVEVIRKSKNADA